MSCVDDGKMAGEGARREGNPACESLARLLSTFVDAFVDFSVSGLFLPQNSSPSSPLDPIPTTYPSPDRLVAVGDLHGDLKKSKEALRLAGLIDSSDRWIGGSTTLIQIGDVLDRGGDEIKILYFLEKLKRQASKSGGTVVTMNGNHEIMNIDGDFRHVTQSGLEEFRVWADWYRVGNAMKSLCDGLPKPKDPFRGLPSVFPNVNQDISDSIRARIAALRPEGPISSRFLSNNLTVAVVGESVFVHGGLLPKHVLYGLDRINEDVREWICGLKGRVSSDLVRGRNSVVWLRKFSHELANMCDCSTLEHVLATIPGAKRMIMGHTIQKSGINGVCDNRAIRIDVGMSKGCINGLPQVLEIINGNSELRVLSANPLHEKRNESSPESKDKEGLGFLVPENWPKQVEVKA